MSSFRPIAPAEPDMDVYAASCNPPRRAKRLRSDSGPPSSPSQPDDDDNDHPQQPPPKRRGRRPGTLSRAAREAQRKINHSLIEKARRTKINDALATLRDLVPPEYKRAPDNQQDDSDDDELDPKKPSQKPKASGEKEFKLEILVRTVAYLQDLTEKVKQLEQNSCPRCCEPVLDTSSRKSRAEDILSQDVATSRSPSVAPRSRLPSIAAWLPSSVEDQRPLLTPSQSPLFDATLGIRSNQLPTPPTSATCAPATAGFPIPPVLTLPSPSTFLPPTTTHLQPRFSGFTPRANAKASPAASPLYTPDDETAASLLLRISTTSSRTASNVATARPVEADTKHALSAGYALTPSRLLGLSAER
ncbi:hypothetical protein J3R83DRAFT_13913 [Lanmaoa asiatica]|nr:hypothetical protein J3R83DRAFT_13913 [Lanmaoa asiatica]